MTSCRGFFEVPVVNAKEAYPSLSLGKVNRFAKVVQGNTAQSITLERGQSRRDSSIDGDRSIRL